MLICRAAAQELMNWPSMTSTTWVWKLVSPLSESSTEQMSAFSPMYSTSRVSTSLRSLPTAVSAGRTQCATSSIISDSSACSRSEGSE